MTQKYGNYQLVVYNNFGKETMKITVHNYNSYRYITANFNFSYALKFFKPRSWIEKQHLKSRSGCSRLRSIVFVTASAEGPASRSCTVRQQNFQSLTSQNWLIQNALLGRLFLQTMARCLVALSPSILLLNVRTPAFKLAHFNPSFPQATWLNMLL